MDIANGYNYTGCKQACVSSFAADSLGATAPSEGAQPFSSAPLRVLATVGPRQGAACTSHSDSLAS